MNQSAGGSMHRVMALLLFVGIPAILLSLSTLNVLAIIDDTMEIATKSVQVAAFERRLNGPAADGKPVDVSRIYLTGTSRTLASANLQQRVVSMIAATSGRLIETAAVDLPLAEGDESDDIRLKATLDTDNDGLLQLLYVLESGLPLLDVETVSIRRMANDSDDDKTEMLRVDILLRGHWRQQGA